MPSFGLNQKLGVAVLAAAMFALSATAASANEAWVWACHGPNGGPIATAIEPGKNLDATAAVNCAGADDTGATLSLDGAAPAGRSRASASIKLPAGVTAGRVIVTHAVHGSAAGARYTVALDGAGTLLDQPLDAPVANLPSDFTKSGSGTLTFSLTCDQAAACAGPVSVDVVKVAVLVDDARRPYGSVGRNSPVNQSTSLTASAIEEGVGYSRVEATISTHGTDQTAVAMQTTPIGSCNELSPGNATIDLPLDPTRCLSGALPTTLSINTASLREGTYYRRLVVYDAAGNFRDLLENTASVYEPFEVWHPVLGSPTQTLSIGSSSAPDAQPQVNPNQNNNGNKGNQSTACRAPRLSVSLAQKPLRVSKSVAVLEYGKRYRFEGRLTCVVNNRRVSAPKRTKVELLNKIGSKTVTRTGPRIATKGRFTVSLKYPKGSRTLIFRFRNADGQRSQVSIKIKTEKKKTSK